MSTPPTTNHAAMDPREPRQSSIPLVPAMSHYIQGDEVETATQRTAALKSIAPG